MTISAPPCNSPLQCAQEESSWPADTIACKPLHTSDVAVKAGGFNREAPPFTCREPEPTYISWCLYDHILPNYNMVPPTSSGLDRRTL